MSEAASSVETPVIRSERLWSDLMSTARFGAQGETGMRRLALTDEDRQMRDWFVAECRALGCTIDIDRIGNIFATYPGLDASLAPIAIGSHLDTQPAGGRFDGILGVLAGIEVLRALNDAKVRPAHPITVICWTNEEGSRFAPAMMGSGMFCGVHQWETVGAARDKSGISVAEALNAIGYAGDRDPGFLHFSSYLELHIEQGPILEAENIEIGVVEAVQGVCWLDIRVPGVEAHAGGRPMSMRDDALVAASKIVLAVQAVASGHPPGVGTVGFASVEPNSRNVIPGTVALEVDLRHPDDAELSALELELTAEVRRICPAAEVRRVWRKPPVAFDPRIVNVVADQASELGYTARRMVSGAGHDAAHLAGVTPTAMIFIPSYMGLSHNVIEYSSPEQCAKGATVLLRAVLDLDARCPARGTGS
ncbi:hydantoinase/carbamoylase family amidase [Burkholderia multivorans]|uniref:hydantoinase/carbamoylase family amidase n=1 Tax=Burkholderia multivorans TaxID=87883 RepID=UPI001C238595|nr:hydantoinase/carbamoylase family amidase [Burkholderia multivorans]MBU9228080.1 hydantoinase/carbamoylase family amidase [Burkholderia multivorans]